MELALEKRGGRTVARVTVNAGAADARVVERDVTPRPTTPFGGLKAAGKHGRKR